MHIKMTCEDNYDNHMHLKMTCEINDNYPFICNFRILKYIIWYSLNVLYSLKFITLIMIFIQPLWSLF